MCERKLQTKNTRNMTMTKNRNRKSAKRDNARAIELGDDLRITKTTRRAAGAGTWVIGTIAGHKFNVLVFSEHAECLDYELGDSRISKLWLKNQAHDLEVANFDRGWDVHPRTKEAQAIINFLAAGLAEHVYHK
jgi:hypothetical protein